MKEKIKSFLNTKFAFGASVISGLLIMYYFVFARNLLSGEYTFGGDTYLYWSFRYMMLYSIKHFNSLPWWDPTNFGGYPLYFHFLSGWSNYLSPYYLPSLILFKALNLFADVSINGYLVFHQTIYMTLLNMIAIYLISGELIKNRIASILPVFIFTFSYFQLMNFHDFYAYEALAAPLFFIFGLVRFNNKRTRGNLILLLILTGMLFASLDNGIVMSAVFWLVIFTVLLAAFNISLIKDAARLLSDLLKTSRGKIIAALLILLLISGLLSSFLPFYLNAGHILKYRGGQDGRQPVVYNSGGITEAPYMDIATSEIWSIFLSWLPFPEVHDNLLRFTWDGHENRYIGLVTLPLILTAITLCLRNRYVYILFMTYFLCNAFVIYAINNIVYRILIDYSEIFRNVTNMSTVFPRGGPPIFLIFLAGIGLDKLIGITLKNEETSDNDQPFERLFKNVATFLIAVSSILILTSIASAYSQSLFWMRHTLAHIGIYLLLFTFIIRLLFISNNKIVRRSLLFGLALLTFTDLTVSASAYIINGHNFTSDDTSKHMIIPYNELSSMGLTVPDNSVFRPIDSESENMFPLSYVGVYHNSWRIQWSSKEWLMLATREDGLRFLPNWSPRVVPPINFTSGVMSKYPAFELYSNGYYIPFEKIKELDTDKSIYDAQPLFYLHDRQLVNSRNVLPEHIPGEYLIKEYTPNKVVTDIKTDRDGILYFLDNIDPFWSAYIDGKKTKIHRANFTFKAVELPAGRHAVEWIYNPYPVKALYAAFYLLLTVLCAFLLYIFISRDDLQPVNRLFS